VSCYTLSMGANEQLEQRYRWLFPHLNERQQHLVAAADAQQLGQGGVARVSGLTGFSRPTIYRAVEDLARPPLPVERVRHSGAGRKTLVEHDPRLVQALEALIDPDTRGDPMSPLRWTCKSTRQLARLLTAQGHPVSHMTVAQLLHGLRYSLQGNAKTKEGKQHPDRDTRFRYIQRQGESFLSRGRPVISVDTKKKELVGNYKNSGQEWQPEGCPVAVDVHDFPDPDIPKAVPRGVYDPGLNLGWVTVGCSHDTACFAVESIRRWWREMGHPLYPRAGEVLICADSGGSNGYRIRLWKLELQRWADETGLDVTVCHYPPGTSKWNKIEHRLFSHISMNWRGRPLVSYQVIVNLIGATTTQAGLRVQADLDTDFYPTKVKVTDKQLATVDLNPHRFHGEWNYTIKHRRGSV
jgi:Rhodopirellula transposase DDE domain